MSGYEILHRTGRGDCEMVSTDEVFGNLVLRSVGRNAISDGNIDSIAGRAGDGLFLRHYVSVCGSICSISRERRWVRERGGPPVCLEGVSTVGNFFVGANESPLVCPVYETYQVVE